MKAPRKSSNLWKILASCIVGAGLVLGVACASAEPTPTPVSPAQPVAPTAAPQPTPTRVLPTATPVVTGKPRIGGTLRFAPLVAWDTFDPAYMVQTGHRPATFAIYSSLVQSMPDASPGADLARSWEFSADGKVVTFNLQPGVKFTDGTPVDARAIKWNYDRHLDPDVGSVRRKELSPPLERVEAPDDLTVKFHLSTPFRPLFAFLMERAGYIVSPTAVQNSNSYDNRDGDFGKQAIGSGPFKLESWTPGRQATLVRNEGYWEKGKPYLDAIKMFFLGDKQIEFAMLRTGELDIMQDMRAADVALAQNNPQVQVIQQTGTSFRFIWFRLGEEPWGNKALRQALAYALDRETLVDVIYQGLATPAHQPIGPAYGQWFDSSIRPYAYNPQKARAKLDEAGYPDGFSYTQNCRATASELQWCEAVQAMWSEVGIDVEFRPYPTKTHWTDFFTGKYNTPILTWISPRNDPHINIQRIFHTIGGTNAIGYSRPDLDKLIDEAATVYDIARAKQLYHDALSIIAEDVAMIFLVYETNLYGIRSNVKNFAPRLDNVPRLRELWLER